MGRRVLPLLDKLGVPCRPLNGYAFGPLMPGSASSMWQSSFIVKSDSVAPTRLLPLIASHATVTRAPAAAKHLTRRFAIGRTRSWASLGVGGQNTRKLPTRTYEMVALGWQADLPSRGGRLPSKDGRSAVARRPLNPVLTTSPRRLARLAHLQKTKVRIDE
ncbi:hypothetical protein AURDEDRAFT_178292 [Auricularia subglabra TFB-10046 SS5]|uniref:Uncharacterized protein n=1 Tax=Auricularia subglabra (strain TFB-10046 / SS5) TaxID=717982 RepID=J0WK03_AURST|nr:hypothetical protein AURDEDRAFT_178292 [Auricularia subglabra TFB-10046 SS5]